MKNCAGSFAEESPYAEALSKTGEAFEEMGGVLQETEAKMSECFLQPLTQTLEGDFKEWQNQKKKLESRRLDYDAKNTKLKNSKGPNNELENEVEVARNKFDETLRSLQELMTKIHTDNEQEEIERLLALVDVQQAYFAKGLEIFTSLKEQLSELNKDSKPKLNRKSSTLLLKDREKDKDKEREREKEKDKEDSVSNGSNENADSEEKEKDKDKEKSAAAANPVPAPRKTGTLISLDDEPTSPGTTQPPAKPPVTAKPEIASKPELAAKPEVAAKPAAKPRPATTTTKVEKRVGLFAFKPENSDELGFNKGDVIVVLEKNDDGWWEGELNGKKGVFPSNYTSPFEG